MIRYTSALYETSSTRVRYGTTLLDPIVPTCGVKQGDPLSPMLFNCVIDRMLKKLHEGIGVDMGGVKTTALSFADDIILVASTKNGLQQSLDSAVGYLGSCGLRVNANKCLIVGIRTVPREKKTVVDADAIFTIDGREVRALTGVDEFTYLGLPFTADGRATVHPAANIAQYLIKIAHAMLKPQQRLFALRVVMLIPF